MGSMPLKMKRIVVSVLLPIAMGWGCAGTKLGGLDGTSELPKEITADGLAQRFEVRDEQAAAQATAPSTTESTAKAASKKKTKTTATATGKKDEPFSWINRRPSKEFFWVGERQTFEITYFGVAAGNLTVEVLPYKTINGRKVYHVKGNATSSKVFSLFYELNDTVETYFDYEGLFSHRFQIELNETKQTRKTMELNDSEKKQTFYWNRWNHHQKGYIETKEFQPIPAFAQDSLSALYFTRTLPLEVGKEYSFPVVSEGKFWDLVVNVVRKEKCTMPGRKEVMCLVLRPDTRFQGVLTKQGDSFLWITDDDRRYLVQLEAKVRIGTVSATLKQVEPGTAP